jgi:hypothetical protein
VAAFWLPDGWLHVATQLVNKRVTVTRARSNLNWFIPMHRQCGRASETARSGQAPIWISGAPSAVATIGYYRPKGGDSSLIFD